MSGTGTPRTASSDSAGTVGSQVFYSECMGRWVNQSAAEGEEQHPTAVAWGGDGRLGRPPGHVWAEIGVPGVPHQPVRQRGRFSGMPGGSEGRCEFRTHREISTSTIRYEYDATSTTSTAPTYLGATWQPRGLQGNSSKYSLSRSREIKLRTGQGIYPRCPEGGGVKNRADQGMPCPSRQTTRSQNYQQTKAQTGNTKPTKQQQKVAVYLDQQCHISQRRVTNLIYTVRHVPSSIYHLPAEIHANRQ